MGMRIVYDSRHRSWVAEQFLKDPLEYSAVFGKDRLFAPCTIDCFVFFGQPVTAGLSRCTAGLSPSPLSLPALMGDTVRLGVVDATGVGGAHTMTPAPTSFYFVMAVVVLSILLTKHQSTRRSIRR
jgi:hypothetical protein